MTTTVVVVSLSAGDILGKMSVGDRFSVSRKGGTRGGGWVHSQGENAQCALDEA